MGKDNVQKAEDIKDFPTYPAGTDSALSRNLTRDVWNKLKDKKDKFGFSLQQCILSGAVNLDSGIGVYAGSHDAYYTFSPLFDKIIEEYHGHKKTDKHISNMDASQLNAPPFPADEDAMIASTRVRVARNLADYPLGPGVTREQRVEIEKKVIEACSKFTGDLKGKYYSLGTMSKADQDQLIADHFLFKRGDRFLEYSYLNRDWPEGRGIFHNNNKTFLVWVNEEDQLRIISMQKGSNLYEVFERLSRASEGFEKVAKFAHDDHLGYITSCPTNLGTGLRASVHIRLPKLAKDRKKFEEIADKYYVQIRGIHGEHTESVEPVFDISNKRRLGRSEVALVQDMYDGVKAMIKAEKSL